MTDSKFATTGTFYTVTSENWNPPGLRASFQIKDITEFQIKDITLYRFGNIVRRKLTGHKYFVVATPKDWSTIIVFDEDGIEWRLPFDDIEKVA